ncbi:hypothetical protein J8273_6127 [Carpediemonas membranifera]|uniref:Uncharacterized protein n=1 Tax=Carpediemonas membranifera TaxID=201153 RepID=A0A8J6DZY3_9EUKA|nr:hypothetical protein J8273_6127 [Carpediemonas membranifera]|eukprot:KAG9391373.1 hypothetical protein J8273_6127 [Carpediemonas membranifera]
MRSVPKAIENLAGRKLSPNTKGIYQGIHATDTGRAALIAGLSQLVTLTDAEIDHLRNSKLDSSQRAFRVCQPRRNPAVPTPHPTVQTAEQPTMSVDSTRAMQASSVNGANVAEMIEAMNHMTEQFRNTNPGASDAEYFMGSTAKMWKNSLRKCCPYCADLRGLFFVDGRTDETVLECDFCHRFVHRICEVSRG